MPAATSSKLYSLQSVAEMPVECVRRRLSAPLRPSSTARLGPRVRRFEAAVRSTSQTPSRRLGS